ncbi:hypothetical protein B0A52_01040 [Exophiala mesophila]|uniref:Uncharacterized protein n=1 Tax=Exophiala mesophila TaxID=212818 RepID=A0A438NGB1_EXOME|nr:hypothetical protein B0A52_01040 [Exophiala mesophila]
MRQNTHLHYSGQDKPSRYEALHPSTGPVLNKRFASAPQPSNGLEFSVYLVKFHKLQILILQLSVLHWVVVVAFEAATQNLSVAAFDPTLSGEVSVAVNHTLSGANHHITAKPFTSACSLAGDLIKFFKKHGVEMPTRSKSDYSQATISWLLDKAPQGAAFLGNPETAAGHRLPMVLWPYDSADIAPRDSLVASLQRDQSSLAHLVQPPSHQGDPSSGDGCLPNVCIPRLGLGRADDETASQV